MWNLEKWCKLIYLQGRSRDATWRIGPQTRLGERIAVNQEISIDVRVLPCVWEIANGNLPWASLGTQTVKNLRTMQETQVRSLGWEDPLKKRMATHFSILPWRIPLQYFCRENPMDRGVWQAADHGVAKSQTWLSNLTTTMGTCWIAQGPQLSRSGETQKGGMGRGREVQWGDLCIHVVDAPHCTTELTQHCQATTPQVFKKPYKIRKDFLIQNMFYY